MLAGSAALPAVAAPARSSTVYGKVQRFAGLPYGPFRRRGQQRLAAAMLLYAVCRLSKAARFWSS
ncbi:hypothetical protein NPIL_668571, partial [Nephila pilipes]